MSSKTKVITTIKEYLAIVDSFKGGRERAWYRGQSNTKYQLEPSLFRHKKQVVDPQDADLPRTLVPDDYITPDDLGTLPHFKKYYQLMNSGWEEYSEIDYLYLMQHYGIPTRLLDFSKDPLIALFFSVCKTKDGKQPVDKTKDRIAEELSQSHVLEDLGSSVFVIDPIYTNWESFPGKKKTKEVVDLSKYKFSSLKNLEFPVSVETTITNSRISAQSGVFLYFGSKVHPYDFYTIFNKRTLKILIPNYCREEIKKELNQYYGISYATVYPDIEGLTLDMKDVMFTRFKESCEDFNKNGLTLR